MISRHDSITQLGATSTQAAKLQRVYGISDVETFTSYASLRGGSHRLARVLGVSVKTVNAYVAEALRGNPTLAADAAITCPQERFTGCLESGQHSGRPHPKMPAIDASALPRSILRVEQLSTIKDQGVRGTCVAFAFITAMERVHGGDLSEQFFYWACKQRDGRAGDGTFMGVASQVARQVGACMESMWPYQPIERADGDRGQGPPPKGCAEDAAVRRLPGAVNVIETHRSADLPASVAACLVDHDGWAWRPVAFSMPLHESFFSPVVRRSGRVPRPLPGERVTGHHAMVVVGYVRGEQFPGGGIFVVRNSWSGRWAAHCEYGAGHCLITWAHFAEHCSTAFVATDSPYRSQGSELEELAALTAPIHEGKSVSPLSKVAIAAIVLATIGAVNSPFNLGSVLTGSALALLVLSITAVVAADVVRMMRLGVSRVRKLFAIQRIRRTQTPRRKSHR